MMLSVNRNPAASLAVAARRPHRERNGPVLARALRPETQPDFQGLLDGQRVFRCCRRARLYTDNRHGDCVHLLFPFTGDGVYQVDQDRLLDV